MSVERNIPAEEKKNIVSKIGSWVVGVIGWIKEVLGFKKKGG